MSHKSHKPNSRGSYIWSNYSDLTRPHPKWWFSKGIPLISGKSRLVKYYNLARYIVTRISFWEWGDHPQYKDFWPWHFSSPRNCLCQGSCLRAMVHCRVLYFTVEIETKLLYQTGWCSTPTQLLICSSFNRENGHPLLICSSLSTQIISIILETAHLRETATRYNIFVVALPDVCPD